MKRGAVVGIIAGSVAVALVAGGAAWWFLTRAPSADAAASEYVAALAAGDYARVAALLPDELRDADDAAAIEQAFAGASAYIDAGAVTKDSEAKASAAFTAEVTLGAETTTLAFTLELNDGEWQLTGDHLAAASVTTTLGTQVRIGDAVVDAGDVTLLPAEYPVVAAPTAILAGESTLIATTEAPASVKVDASLAPDADAAVQAQLDSYLATCTAAAAAIPSGCGIRVPWGADLAAVTGFAYRIETAPTVALAPDARAFEATGGDLVITATGTTREGATASFTYRDTAWSVRGVVGFDAEGIVLSVF